MISVQNTQSLTDFRQKASETIDRINRTGDAEIITVNGEARAVLVAPAVFDEISREFELASVQRALNQFEQGKGRTIDEFFDELRGKLLSMKTSKRKSPKGKAAK